MTVWWVLRTSLVSCLHPLFRSCLPKFSKIMLVQRMNQLITFSGDTLGSKTAHFPSQSERHTLLFPPIPHQAITRALADLSHLSSVELPPRLDSSSHELVLDLLVNLESS